jgi:PAS domain S-box-containing protein
MTRQSIGQPGGQDEIYHLMIGEVEDYAILMLDPQGHVVSWNRGAEKIKGYREEEILGKHFSIFYRIPRRGDPRQALQYLLSRKRSTTLTQHTHRHRRRQGESHA